MIYQMYIGKVEDDSVNKLQSRENVSKQSEVVDDRDASQTGATHRDGFAEILSAMKSRQAQTSTSIDSYQSMNSTLEESTPAVPVKQQMDNSMSSLTTQFEKTEIDTVYNQIISEDLTEDAMHPKAKDSLDPYDYDPAPPQ